LNTRICLISIYENNNSPVRIFSALLRSQGFGVSEVYFKHWVNNRLIRPTAKEMDLLYQVIKNENPDIIAISLRCSAYEQVTGFITQYLRSRYDAFYLWGGLHPTLEPERCLAHADAVIMGEGEIPLLQLVKLFERGERLDSVPNFRTRDSFGGIQNPISILIENLDDLPFRDFTSDGKYYISRDSLVHGDPVRNSPIFDIMFSRGCPFECTYCYNHILKRIFKSAGKYYRIRSVDNSVAEMRAAKIRNPKTKIIRIDDNIFPFNKTWVDEFCEIYPKEIGLPFNCMLQPNVSTRKLLSDLKQAGLQNVTIGIQSTEKVNFDIYGRKVPDSKVMDFAKDAHAEGIHVNYQVMIDNPLSDEREHRDLYSLLKQIPRPFDLYLFSLTHYPRTLMTERLLKEGKISTDQVEGPGTKTFAQYRVSLNWPRPSEETFWIAVFVLMSKNFISKSFIDRLVENRWLKRHPKPIVFFAQAVNLIKMSLIALRMALKGELNLSFIRQWLNLKSLITS